MSPVQSAQVCGFSKEVTFGTFVPPVNFVPGIANPTTSTKVARPEQSRGTRDYVVDALVGEECGLTVSAELIPEVLPQLFAGWMGVGSDTKTGAAAEGYTHALVPKNTVPSYSFEVDSDITSQVLARQFVGCNVDQITVKGTQQAIATAEFQMIGQREITPTTPGLPSNPTPVINTLQPVDFSLMSLEYLGANYTELQDMTLTMMNHVQRVFSSNKQIYVVRLVPTRREVTFQTTLDFLNVKLYEAWIKGQQIGATEGETAFKFKWETAYKITGSTGETHKYVIELSVPKVRPQGQFNLASASDVLNQQISWSALLGTGGGVVTANFVNAEAAALA
jgi:hypothetical protein